MKKICKKCKHEEEDHDATKRIPCTMLVFIPPTKEEQEDMPEYGGAYELCECTGYKG